MSKKQGLRTPFEYQRTKGSQILLKSARRHFYHIFTSLSGKWSWKKYLLVISEILGLFADTLTADHKYSLRDSEHLQQPI